MSLLCPTSAKVTLPHVLRSIFCPELTHPLRTVSNRRLNLSLRSKPSGRRAITTVSVNDIPVTSAEKPQPQPAVETEFLATEGPSKVSKQSLNGKTSARNRTNAAPSSSSRQTKGNSQKVHSQKNQQKPAPQKRKRPEGWAIQKEALKQKFPQGWAPYKKLSPDAMESIRHLHHVSPDQFTTPVLADEFKVSPEAVRRILKSRWRPSENEAERRQQRWESRHEEIWNYKAELGLRPKQLFGPRNSAGEILYGKKKSTPPGDSP